ncbi:MAG TPA: PEP-CTERM sorting domain-containing protein [Thiobacillus sp.]|nr:PEP-CTERM sorting domain-containing protein [Thiobacillus sp.]
MRINKKAALAVAGLSAVLLSGYALAAVQTLTGTNVTYVYDDESMGLYSQPILSGDSLIFTPTTFKAQSSNVQGIVQTSSTINVQVYANANYNLSAFNLTELGNYYLIGSDAQVAVGGQISLFDLANPPPAANQLTDPITATAPLTATTTLANYQITSWQANAAIAVPANWSNGVNLTIENILLASTIQLGSAAFIEEKFAGSSVILTPVPEAQTYAMMLAGLGLVGFMARRARMIV